MAKIRPSAQEINEKVIAFHNQMLFWFLINSGSSWTVDQRESYLQKTFDGAYEILAYAYDKKDIALFNRIYSETTRLVSGSNVSERLAKIRDDFYTKISMFVQSLKLFVATSGRSY